MDAYQNSRTVLRLSGGRPDKRTFRKFLDDVGWVPDYGTYDPIAGQDITTFEFPRPPTAKVTDKAAHRFGGLTHSAFEVPTTGWLNSTLPGRWWRLWLHGDDRELLVNRFLSGLREGSLKSSRHKQPWAEVEIRTLEFRLQAAIAGLPTQCLMEAHIRTDARVREEHLAQGLCTWLDMGGGKYMVVDATSGSGTILAASADTVVAGLPRRVPAGRGSSPGHMRPAVDRSRWVLSVVESGQADLYDLTRKIHDLFCANVVHALIHTAAGRVHAHLEFDGFVGRDDLRAFTRSNPLLMTPDPSWRLHPVGASHSARLTITEPLSIDGHPLVLVTREARAHGCDLGNVRTHVTTAPQGSFDQVEFEAEVEASSEIGLKHLDRDLTKLAAARGWVGPFLQTTEASTRAVEPHRIIPAHPGWKLGFGNDSVEIVCA